MLANNPVSFTAERRRYARVGIDPRASVKHALAHWQRVQAAWLFILESARRTQNGERTVVAQSKLDECEREIARLEKLLRN